MRRDSCPWRSFELAPPWPTLLPPLSAVFKGDETFVLVLFCRFRREDDNVDRKLGVFLLSRRMRYDNGGGSGVVVMLVEVVSVTDIALALPCVGHMRWDPADGLVSRGSYACLYSSKQSRMLSPPGRFFRG